TSPVRWEKGANVIVIPKSAFTNTKLNAAIQQAVDDQGNVNWSVMPDCLKTDSEITGLDRQNAADDTSEWLELMISKKKCSVDEANAILELLLTGIVNESTGEEGYINEYDDNSGHIAVLMNLAEDVLKIVPMKDMGWRNDGQGDRPKEFDEWVRELAEAFLELITALIAAIGNFIAGLIEAAVEAGLKFVQAIVAAVMALIELILKALLLALIYAFFALVIATLIFTISIMALTFMSVIAIIGGFISYKVNYLKASLFQSLIECGYETDTEFNFYLDLDVPIVLLYLYMNNQKLYEIIIGFFPPKMEFVHEELEGFGSGNSEIYSLTSQNIIGDASSNFSNSGLAFEGENNSSSSEEKVFIKSPVPKWYWGPISIDFEFECTREDVDYYYYLYRNGEILLDKTKWFEKESIYFDKDGNYDLLVITKDPLTGEILATNLTKFIVVFPKAFVSGIGFAMSILGATLFMMDGFLLSDTSEQKLPKKGILVLGLTLVGVALLLVQSSTLYSWSTGVVVGYFTGLGLITIFTILSLFVGVGWWEYAAVANFLFSYSLILAIVIWITGLYIHNFVFHPVEDIVTYGIIIAVYFRLGIWLIADLGLSAQLEKKDWIKSHAAFILFWLFCGIPIIITLWQYLFF
ncbi:MAG: hypothetical protein ACTSRG_25745, partial [Candidatus Helarchaeota archaeon]